MKRDRAEKAAQLLRMIADQERIIKRLKKELGADMTGLDPNTPGGACYMQDVLKDEWSLLGESFAAFFVTEMKAAIRRMEDELIKYTEQLKRL